MHTFPVNLETPSATGETSPVTPENISGAAGLQLVKFWHFFLPEETD